MVALEPKARAMARDAEIWFDGDPRNVCF